MEPHLAELEKLAVQWRDETPWEVTWSRPQPYMSPYFGEDGARLQRFAAGSQLRKQYGGYFSY